MATLVSQGAVADGYDVTFSTIHGRFTIHWATQPSEDEIDERIDMYERLWTEEIAAQQVVEKEESDDGL